MRDGIQPDAVMRLFSQMLDGVEAAYLQGVVHRDLKPENILYDAKVAVAEITVAIADWHRKVPRGSSSVLSPTCESQPLHMEPPS
jgi:serine/threonine protein kinase